MYFLADALPKKKCCHVVQVKDLTENRDILNKYTIISLFFFENVVSSNIEISQVRPPLISPKNFFNKSSQMEPVVIWCVTTRKFRQ